MVIMIFPKHSSINTDKKGLLGTKELNKALQQALNPNNGSKKEKVSNGATFRVGDRVMQIKTIMIYTGKKIL